MNVVEQIFNIGGTVIPDEVWDCPNLTPTDIKLYKVLLDYGKKIYGLKNGKFTTENYPIIKVAQATLAEKVGVSVKTIQSSLERLTSVKLIKVDRHNGYKRHNLIILTGEFYGISPNTGKEGRRLTVVEKQVKRVSIKRVPIKFSNVATETEETVTQESHFTEKLKGYEEKLKELGGVAFFEKPIIAISKHYDMLASRFNHFSGYRSLPNKDPQNHKNWKPFVRLYELCEENGWDAKLYLDAQFERAKKYWKNSRMKYPLPTMLCSEKSKQYFERFLEDRKQKYEHDMDISHVERGQRTVSTRKKVIQDVLRSAEYLSMYIREDGDEQDKAEDKAVRIFQSWESYSPAYLWSVGWFRDFIDELERAQPENEKIKEVKAELDMIDRSKSLQEIINTTVRMAEDEFGLPGNIAI